MKLTNLIEESYNQVHLEEQSRFWKEIEKMPLDKRVDAIRKLWSPNMENKFARHKNLNKFNFYNRDTKIPENINKSKNNTITDLNTHYFFGNELKDPENFYQDLKKNFRQADKYINDQLNNPNRQISYNKSTLERLKKTRDLKKQNAENLTPDQKNTLNYFAHSGSENYLKNFLNGKNPGYLDNGGEHDVLGIQVTRQDEPIKRSSFSERAALALDYGDVPASLSGKATADKFNDYKNDYNSTLMAKPNLPKEDYKLERFNADRFIADKNYRDYLQNVYGSPSYLTGSLTTDTRKRLYNGINNFVDENKLKNKLKAKPFEFSDLDYLNFKNSLK